MVSATGQVKVLDFGLAKVAVRGLSEEHSRRSSAADGDTIIAQLPESNEGSIAGTVAYMSPEQAQGLKIDARSDIFSFGVLFYEMLTGKRPFAGENSMRTLSAILTAEPKPTREVAEDIPAEVDRVVMRCLRKDPARRFQNMSDLNVAVEELRDESDSGGLRIAAPSRAEPQRLLVLIIGVAAMAIAAAAGAWWARRSVPAVAPQRLVSVTSYPGWQIDPALSPNGGQVAFAWTASNGGQQNTDVYVKLIGQPDALRLTTDPAEDRYPAWSPDGRMIAFRRSRLGIYAVSALGGTERKLTDFASDGPLAWSPDGKWLATTSATHPSAIVLLPLEGGELHRVTGPQAPAYDKNPVFSRDGKMLAYAHCRAEFACDVYVQKIDESGNARGSATPITRRGFYLTGTAWSSDGKSVVFSGSTSAPTIDYLWQASIEGQAPAKRIEVAGPNVHYPSISGDRLAFSRDFMNLDIWRYLPNGETEPIITSTLQENNPRFSPDGSKIAFASNRLGEGNEIWLALADGTGVSQLTDHVGRSSGSPSWSPDGRLIAFDSQAQNGRWSIRVVDSSGGKPRRITDTAYDALLPGWSADGKWIYFCSNRTGNEEIWRLPFEGGFPEQVTFRGGQTAVESQDGKILYFTRSDDSPLFSMSLSRYENRDVKSPFHEMEQQILPEVRLRNFAVTKRGIYYVTRISDARLALQFFDFSSKTSRTLKKLELVGEGMSVAPNGKTLLFATSFTAGADLEMIENFK